MPMAMGNRGSATASWNNESVCGSIMGAWL
jgi:hypothetical protein